MPTKPARPHGKCDRGIYVNVEWRRPDGGADVTGYVIKYLDEYTRENDFTIVKVVGDTTNFTFTDQLKEGTKYRFAVAADNTEFSEFSDYVSTGSGKH